MYQFVIFFFFKQKTAYEMHISDWSSDVCSSDLTQVVATDGAIPRRSAHSLFVSTTVSLSVARTSASPSRLRLSQTPVRDTPRRRSSSHVSFHFFLRYLTSVQEDCIVPSIAAILAFRLRLSTVSHLRTTTSVRLPT